jgi:hypothetical protein
VSRTDEGCIWLRFWLQLTEFDLVHARSRMSGSMRNPLLIRPFDHQRTLANTIKIN